MTAPVLLMAAIIAVSMPGQRWPALRHLPVYLLTDRPISFVLYAYALANVHNVSWGTKGLTRDPCGHTVEERRMRRLRDIIAGSIVALTAMLVAVGSEYPGAWVRSESSVIEVFTLIFLVVLSVAAATWAYAAGRSLLALGGELIADRARTPSAAGAVILAQATQEA
jgi:hypothetical protein